MWVCGYSVRRISERQWVGGGRNYRRWQLLLEGPGFIGGGGRYWTERGAHHAGSRLALKETRKREKEQKMKDQTFNPYEEYTS